ncbi:hypothetical protein [Alicyclobacillus sp. SP_1]|uniref:hypothetical protein n=1 Tax=Alicyclobacillus sp. SP_1 TaxID=2942475 RepID=UPI0021581DFA|nr:hypothetical protein [Alicyclobacillus sp. SP_1]
MLTVDQLCALLHDQPDSMYQTLGKMRKRDWVQPMRLAFLRRNVKGWVLTKEGLPFAFGLTKETRAGLLRQQGNLPDDSSHLGRLRTPHGNGRHFASGLERTMGTPGIVEGLSEHRLRHIP